MSGTGVASTSMASGMHDSKSHGSVLTSVGTGVASGTEVASSVASGTEVASAGVVSGIHDRTKSRMIKGRM